VSLRILVVDDNEDIRQMTTTSLRKAGFEAECHESALLALAEIKNGGKWDVVVTDLRMPGMDGIQFLKEIKALNVDIAVIMITAHATVSAAIDAMRLGAVDFILKPFEFDQLKIRLDRIDESRNLRREVATLRKALGTAASTQMIVHSPGMLLLLERVKKAAASDAAILILGESGTGKECIAHALCRESAQWNKIFVARNCAAIPDTLFESEMFGHKKGAFTGADKDRKGAFAEADGGTLFLDEIGDLSYPLQTKLLRAIQERVIRPVGSDTDQAVSFRLICATNKNLLECCKNKKFREDLYYRLATVTLTILPLRERREDILPLARHFARLLSNGTRTLSASAEESLLRYSWPGNVRELRSVIEQGVIFSAGNEIEAAELGITRNDQERSGTPSLALSVAERGHILQVLQSVNGNKSEAAKLLEVARSTLILKLKSYGVNGD
jgi:DNA-binding NtrC family response regulator